MTVEQLRPEHLRPCRPPPTSPAAADRLGLEGGESQGRDTACLSMACPQPGQAPASAVGEPFLTLLPAGYFR